MGCLRCKLDPKMYLRRQSLPAGLRPRLALGWAPVHQPVQTAQATYTNHPWVISVFADSRCGHRRQ
jgi:hypothetical protein